MSTISERLDAFRERVAGAADAADAADVDRLVLWREGGELRLREPLAVDRADDASRAAFEQSLEGLRTEVVAAEPPEGLPRWVRDRIDELADALDDAASTGGPISNEIARAILAESRWLRVLLARAGRGRVEVALAEACREAAAFARAAEPSETVRGAYLAVRLELLAARVELIEKAFDEEPDPDAWPSRAAALEEIVDDLEPLAADACSPDGADDTHTRARALLERARAEITDAVRTLSPEESRTLVEAVASFALERVDEALVTSIELPPDDAAVQLARARERASRVLALWTSVPRTGRLPRVIRKLRAFRRRLGVEEQERGLQSRLEMRFGARFVGFFENLILFLILAVVGLLAYEAMIMPAEGETIDATTQRKLTWLLWLDTGVCAVFLLEFFTKLVMVPFARGRWFLRHFLIDFLPSIPFGLLEAGILQSFRALRLARFARLGRVARYLRAARPFIRLFRILAFMLRGLDRMVHRNSHVLNRDVLLFSPAPTVLEENERLDASIPAELEERAGAWLGESLDGLVGAERERLAHVLLEETNAYVSAVVRAVPTAMVEIERAGHGREIRIEQFVAGLVTADAASVERGLGVDLAARLADKIRRLDLPLVRRMPFIHQFVPGSRRLGDGELVARAARATGRFVRRLYDRVLAMSDLSGMISGPQMLDRVGGAIAKSTKNPAKRLLLFGSGFLVVAGLVEILGISWLDGVMTFLDRFVGIPILVLGGVSLILFSLGVWFQRIAGEATDFLERTAEAQFLNLLKVVKRRTLDEDLLFLHRRVDRPERMLGEGAHLVPPETEAIAELRADLERWFLGPAAVGSRSGFGERPDEAVSMRVLGLFEDYLDGAILHRSDAKTCEQLLGNLAMINLIRHRLRLDRASRKRLGRLDLARRQGLRGPHMWFQFITRTIAQRTAEIVLDFNRHCVPLRELREMPEAEQASIRAWVTARIAGERPDEVPEEGFHRCTAFNALHVLSPDESADQAIADQFGPDVAEALRVDRTSMIREVFGTYPLHRLPRRRRTLNPYELYLKHVSGFRVLWLPLTFLKFYLIGFASFVRRIGQIVSEVQRPELARAARAKGIAGFDVAVRKISRMRRPVFVEAAWLRAMSDVEYLGLRLPGVDAEPVPTFEDDFALVGMEPDEHERFLNLREDRRRDLRVLRGVLLEEQVTPQHLDPLLWGGFDEATVPARRVMRSIVMGFALDDRNCRTYLTARPRIEEALRSAIQDPLDLPAPTITRRVLGAFRRALGRVWGRLDPDAAAIAGYRRIAPEVRTEADWKLFERAVRSNYRNIRRLVRIAGHAESAAAMRDEGLARLRRVTADHARLEEELVTLRTIQSLSILDIRNYRNLIRRLGGFDREGTPRMTVARPETEEIDR